MKKIFITALAMLLLCSCSSGSDKGFFAYQEEALTLCGTLEINGGEFTAELKASAPGEGGGRDMTISFTQPEDAAGLVLIKSGSERFAESGGVRIPVSEAAVPVFEMVQQMLSLTPDMIYNIKADGELSRAELSGGGVTGTAATDAAGQPSEISLTFSDGRSISYKRTA